MRTFHAPFLLSAILSLLACSSSSQDSGTLVRGSGSDESSATPSATGDASGSETGVATSTGTRGGSASAAPSASGSADPASPAGSGDGSTGNQQLPAPGQLTGGAWDDNRNFDRFSEYRASLEADQLPGIIPTTDQDHQAANEKYGTLSAHARLDVALVLDTTGSMGDEISYLQGEFTAISSSINAKYPNADQHWSLVTYRDELMGDAYVTRSFDFSADLVAFRKNLSAQGADGGGDTPEAADQGLAVASNLSWRPDEDVARLAFWVADAPHHAAKAGAMRDAIAAIAQLGVHIYPIAASGVDELTELTMRSAAQLSGGRYLFLTNDSGIGGDHKEPSIPCYFVTKLNDGILRMIDIEMSGLYREPTPEEIIRTGGNPHDGACTLDSGETVFVF